MAAFRLTPVRWVYLIVALFVAIILSLVLLFQFQTNAFVAIRFHIGGEGLWAKAQKDAVRSLEHYAVSHDEVDYQAYQRQIQVPLADQQARLELQKTQPDLDIVRAGYLRGRNHPEDIDYAIPFFLRFQHSAHVAHVIEHWTEADRLIAALNQLAERFHEAQSSGRATPETTRAFLAELDDLDQRLAVEEDQFSSTLAEASRWANNVSRHLTYAITLLFVALGLGLSRPIITHLRATERALSASEERFRSIFEQVGDIIYTVEPDGTFSAISPSCERLLGWSPDEWIGRPFSLVVHPDDLPRIQALSVKAQAGEPLPTFQLRVLTKAGGYRESEVTVNLVRRDHSFVMLGVLRDITERNQREQTLRNMAAKFHAMFELSPAAIMLFDEGGFFDCNPATLRLYGCPTRADFIHKHPSQFSPPTQPGGEDSMRLANERIATAFKNGSNQFEWMHCRLDGTAFPAEVMLTALELDGKPVIQAIVFDSTERQQANEALKRKERHFQKMIEGGSDVFFLMDRAGTVLYRSDSGKQLTGWDTAEVLGKPVTDFVPAESLSLVRSAMAEIFAKPGQLIKAEVFMLRKDGTRVEVEVIARNLFDDPDVAGVVITAHDISERKQATELLRENQARLDLALRSARMGVWHFDIIENRRYFDDQVCHLLGLDPATFAGTAEEFFGALHPDDRAIVKAALTRTIEQDAPYEPDYRVVWPDGSVHYITARARLVHDEQGRPMRIRGIIWDITDRKQADQMLREREDMLSKIMGSAQDAILMLDNGGNVVLWNAAAEKIFGYSNEEALGKNLHLLLAPSRFHEAHQDAFDRFKSSGEGAVIGKTLELAALRKDGTEFPMELSLSTVRLKEQWHAVGIVRDITERKKSEEGLRLFRALLDHSIDAIEVLDPDTFQFLDTNQKAYQALGYSREELLSLSVFDIDPTLERAKATEVMQGLRKFGSLTHEGRHRRKDGTEFPVEINLGYVQLDRDYMVSVVRDITTRKQAEQALERSNRALRTLSACNEALVRDTNEAKLLASICRLIVDLGGYRMAWVGFPEQDPAKTVRSVAHYGHEEGYLTAVKFSWADSDLGRGPTGTALRTGIVQVNRSFQTNAALAPWREAAQQRGYQSSIALPLLNSTSILGVLTIYASEANAFDDAEVRLLQELAGDLAFGIEMLRMRIERDRIANENLNHSEVLRQSLEDSVKAIASTVEMRDPYTAGHQRRVGQLAAAIARELGLPEHAIRGLELAASIHDLGKISVPAEILAKPSKLTAIETMLLKNHAQAGYDILKDIKFPWPIAAMVWQHHERMDGSGYPQGLKGDAILLESRILAVADVAEAMASHRPYRAALGTDRALKELEQGRGTTYDAAVVDACLKLFAEARFAFST